MPISVILKSLKNSGRKLDHFIVRSCLMGQCILSIIFAGEPECGHFTKGSVAAPLSRFKSQFSESSMPVLIPFAFKTGKKGRQHHSGLPLWCWCNERLLWLCFGFREQRVLPPSNLLARLGALCDETARHHSSVHRRHADWPELALQFLDSASLLLIPG